jgi:hypothetical protein
MKISKTLLSSLVLISSQISRAGTTEINVTLGELEKYGISTTIVQEEFYNHHQISLNWDEYLKVSKDDEGKNIRFETYDQYSTVVAIDGAFGAKNKWIPSEF